MNNIKMSSVLMKFFWKLLLGILALFLIADFAPTKAAPNAICYVKWNASGTGNNGTSWTNAYKGILGVQNALANNNCTQIWVAAGQYLPTSGSTRTSTFQLKNNVVLYGGFAGTESALSQRDIIANETILTGNIGSEFSSSDNAYHVVNGSGTNSSAILDGFTISNGYADAGYNPDRMGGGMYISAGTPTIRNVTLKSNYATYGGGLYIINSAISLWGISFDSNSAQYGGGLYSQTSNYVLGNSTFVNNLNLQSTGSGAIVNFNSDPTLSHLTIANNTTTGTTGGGLYNSDSNPEIVNSIFWMNTATSGGYQIYDKSTSSTTINNSVVEGGFTGDNIITDDPNLGPYGDHGGLMQVVPLQMDSSAINAGDAASCATTDQRGLLRSGQGPQCDIGAYEFVPVLYAKSGANTSGFCHTWIVSCELHYTLSIAVEGQEVWVQQGTYKPTATTNRDASFQLKSNVSVYGGFTGVETLRSQRDWEANDTILSGEIGTAALSDNSYHVVSGVGTDATGLLDGVTITKGYANGSSQESYGGGFDGSGTLINVTINNNTAQSGGGGIYASSTDNLFIENVLISDNVSNYRAGGFDCNSCTASLSFVTFLENSSTNDAGGMEVGGSPGADVTLENVVFDTNSTPGDGGGLWESNDNSSLTLTNVTFKNNYGAEWGGGMATRGHPALMNVTFKGNSATYSGGGLAAVYGSGPSLTNVTFYGNHANSEGGGLVSRNTTTTLIHTTFQNNSSVTNGGAIYNWDDSTLYVLNSIIWDNSTGIYNEVGGSVTAENSVIEGGFPGGVSIWTTNPNLQPIGDHGGFTQTIPIGAGSSALDNAKTDYCTPYDQRGIPRPIEAFCDCGSYEYGFLVYIPLILK